MSEFEKKLAQLSADLNTQGARISDQMIRAVESTFDGKEDSAKVVVASDTSSDQGEVEIKRACME